MNKPKWIDFPQVQQVEQGNDLYCDIKNHCKGYQQYDDKDKVTGAHEMTHKCNSDIRNSHNMSMGGPMEGRDFPVPYSPVIYNQQQEKWVQFPVGGRINGFYVGNSRGIVLLEPSIRKSDAIPFIPQNLRGFRFSTYVSGQQAWDDSPLYLLDEHVAYLNGSKSAISMKLPKSNRIIDGAVEFMAYTTGMLMAIKDSIPDALSTFVNWLFTETMHNYQDLNATYGPYETQDKLLFNLKNNQDMVTFLATKIGFSFDGKPEIPDYYC